MTSTNSMQQSLRLRNRSRLRRARVALLLLALFTLLGCAAGEQLQQPLTLVSAHAQTQLWAVAPFANESGVSIVQTERVADLFVEQAEGIHGVNAIPVNRVLMAMRRLGMRSVTTPADAMMLINTLGVDGLIVGTVTAYDPYSPPKFGAAIQLYHRASPPNGSQFDPVALSRARTDSVSLGSRGGDESNQPVAQASAVFDAANHDILMRLDEYAIGRTEPGSAYGKRIYLASMELYTQFAAFGLLRDLLENQRSRTAPEALQPNAR